MNYNPNNQVIGVGGLIANGKRHDASNQIQSIVVRSVAMIAYAAIHFDVTRHNWLFDFVGVERNIKYNIWFLGLLWLLAGIYYLAQRQSAWSRVRAGEAWFLAALVLYAYLGGLSVVINESGLDRVLAFLFYLYGPMLVMLSVVVLHPTDRTIRRTLVVLLMVGLAFSVYSSFLHVLGVSGTDMASYYPNASTLDPESLVRKGVPGLGANMFPSMLVPLVLAGMYFALKSTSRIRFLALAATAFLFLNVLITGSRGAILALAAGLFYLGLRRWFRFNFKLVLAGTLLVLVFAVFGDFVVERFARSVLVMGFEQGVSGSATSRADGYDDRLMVSLDSLETYFAPNPIVGAGFTYHWETQTARNRGTDHNVFTSLLAEGGVFVCVPFVLILFLIYRNAARLLRKCREDRETVELGTILVAGFIAFVVDLNFATGLLLFYSVWWGLLLAWTRNAYIRQLAARRRTRPTSNAVPFRVSIRPGALDAARH